MKRIIVPTDFSPCASNAMKFAVQSAKIFPAEVTLLHSFEVKGSVYTDYMGLNREFTRSMLGDAQEKLELLKKNIERTEVLTIDTVISTKSLNEAIEETIKDKNADLVVMGTLGASGIKGKLWGSRTSAYIGNTDIPVIVVPNEYKWKKPQKILLATNQFEKDPAILNFIFRLAGLYLAQVQVVIFCDETSEEARKFVDGNNEIPLYEKFLKEEYNEKTIITSHICEEGFEKALQEYISENDIDILTMVTYQRNFWESIFHPSKTKRMSYNTNIPLLAIPVV